MGKQAMFQQATLHRDLILTSGSDEEEVGASIELQRKMLQSSSRSPAMTDIQEHHDILSCGVFKPFGEIIDANECRRIKQSFILEGSVRGQQAKSVICLIEIPMTGEIEKREIFRSTIWRTQEFLHCLLKSRFRRLGWFG